ncbi:hypothetical protein FB451DRAFT_1434693, partial [Mycena latifolia]
YVTSGSRRVVSRSASWLRAESRAVRRLCRCVMTSGAVMAAAAMKDPDTEIFPSAEEDRTRAGPMPAVETGGARPCVVRVATGGRGCVSGCGMTADVGAPARVDVELIMVALEAWRASSGSRWRCPSSSCVTVHVVLLGDDFALQPFASGDELGGQRAIRRKVQARRVN